MAQAHTEKFMNALQSLERSSEVSDEMISLFSPECVICNVAITPMRGEQGVSKFWKDYLATFQGVSTEFTHVLDSNNASVLEWTSRGRLTSGRPVHYQGATILEWNNGRITRFMAYHDTAAFLKDGARHLRVAA